MSQIGWRLFQAAIIGGMCYLHYEETTRTGAKPDPAGIFIVGIALAFVSTWILTLAFDLIASLFRRLNERDSEIPGNRAINWRLGQSGEQFDRSRIGHDPR